MKARKVQVRLLISVIGISAAFLVVFGTVAVSEISALTRDRVHEAALSLVSLRAKEIESFFTARGRTVTTMFTNPDLLRWFAEYDEYRRPLVGDDGYKRVLAAFQGVVDSDPSLLSAFLATQSTAEYFRHNGRVDRDGYVATERWWYREAVAKNSLYVTLPGYDVDTGDIFVTIQKPVSIADGRLLGVGGIDFDLDTVGRLVSDLRYRGSGNAFLSDERDQLVFFPGLVLDPESRVGEPLVARLAEVDELFADTTGFAALAGALRERRQGIEGVVWQGEDRIVVFAGVQADQPLIDWTLGLMVPEDLISAAIVRARAVTAVAVLVAVCSIAGLTLFVTNRFARRMREEDRLRAQMLAEANARLLETDRIKSQFLANMSHELRTPLNSIIGFSDILRTRLEDQLDEQFLRFLDNIHGSGAHLLRMISDVLDLAKVEAGTLELSPEQFSVDRIIDPICSIVDGMARKRRIRVEVDLADDLPDLEADPDRFKQILFNLLSNAVKFSNDDSVIRIRGRHLECHESPLAVPSMEIAVSDHGIGVAADDLEVIFEEFRQLESGARRRSGTGLGLALVRRLVEIHHGTIRVKSVVGEGSTFSVILPLEVPRPVADDPDAQEKR